MFNFQTTVVILCILIAWRLFLRLSRNSGLAELPGPPKASWWSGNFRQLYNPNAFGFHLDIARKFGSAILVYRFLGDKELFVFDPLAMHHIFVKDQYIYEETEVFLYRNLLAFGPSLVSTLGEQHRKQRKMLNPVFSMKHMRDLIPVFYPIAHKLCDVLAEEVLKTQGDINVMHWVSRAALEYIGQGGMGYTFDSLDQSKNNSYSEVLKMFHPLIFNLIAYQQLLPFAVNNFPAWMRREFVKFLPSRRVRKLREIVEAMDVSSRKIFAEKKQALALGDEELVKNVGMGKDIMSVLLRANVQANEEDKLPEDELLGQMSTIVFAGHGTTTSAISRALHLLAFNPEVQDRLRKEVSEARAKHGGDLDYDTLMNLPFLDAVCRETLRVYPPVAVVERITRQDVVLPLAWPVKSTDGKREITSIPLQKDTKVIISLLNANRSTRIWGPDADEWKPERWLHTQPESLSQNRLPGVYASMMTFIGGGRACIGFKFAEMEMKTVLSLLLERFIFSPGSQEIAWSMTFVQSPVVKGSGDITPRLPLKVDLVKG